jgi:hypothetical protein
LKAIDCAGLLHRNWLGGYLHEPVATSKKIFIGRLPQEANTDDLWDYFGRFGRIVDAYIPKVGLALSIIAGNALNVLTAYQT